ncbi:S-adenosyl-L-methionine-dependent tRNA 4-demethylwyosine synthase TYW1 isoform X2 [Denticeps clupeoides]|uniref:S-adenosyl-L-methionine-dependent tRNA 4-demethylwyosine synthase TYW1 isoform X2 n=1 Tax=Denticeps clupeoides TaxID=299321 RepID=UPI0010A4B9AB|nr:S-adenosyl-L-methionine-dependent tRNA 4-demethylwyosine synthase isoform X2 [Denticeps clupeoides]
MDEADLNGVLETLCGRWGGVAVSLWQNRRFLYAALAALVGLWLGLSWVLRQKLLSGAEAPQEEAKKSMVGTGEEDAGPRLHVKIFYGSQTGTAKGFAADLCEELKAQGFDSEVLDMKGYDPDDRLAGESSSRVVCVFLLATYTDGCPTENAAWFCKWLEETSTDFRYSSTHLKGLRYAVFGLGNSVYEGHYNTVGKNVDKWLWALSASRILPRGEGDCNVVKSRRGSVQADFAAWKTRLLNRLQEIGHGEKQPCDCRNGSCKNKHAGATPIERHQSGEEPVGCSSSDEDEGVEQPSVMDMEDLGSMMGRARRNKQDEASGTAETSEEERREMITPALRDALSKQGYKLIGSHSGVKLCRWTKAMLRGRGGCYKHTFYGIESHRCMETTPSLACANKCVFCWRHHTNPVGTEWRWKMDQPDMILQEAVEKHRNLIRQFRGVPGVRADRFDEALHVKHCALSLVGEPIMYPDINRFLRLLHQRHISSFLVTNAQFPEEIRTLVPVTQLYVSVDASTRDSLRRIDRPLFKDFWRRFLDSLQALGDKKQRTVYRLTLVKSWNVDELKAYADLIALGQPDFIEVKGVTYCGDSSASNLTMANVPWHQEVIHFVQQLSDLLPDYDIASEHEHSNCLLLAHHKFKVDGEWWTWIDYERFHVLAQRYEDSGGAATFSSLDYVAKTPGWAVFGAQERGFDPSDTRFQRKSKKDISGC